MQLATNHLGHFLLTSLLLPLMKDPRRCILCSCDVLEGVLKLTTDLA